MPQNFQIGCLNDRFDIFPGRLPAICFFSRRSPSFDKHTTSEHSHRNFCAHPSAFADGFRNRGGKPLYSNSPRNRSPRGISKTRCRPENRILNPANALIWIPFI